MKALSAICGMRSVRSCAQTEFREDLDLRNNEAIGKIQQDILREIAAYATSAGFDLVLADGIVYASNRVDVTEPVLERLRATAGDKPAGD